MCAPRRYFLPFFVVVVVFVPPNALFVVLTVVVSYLAGVNRPPPVFTVVELVVPEVNTPLVGYGLETVVVVTAGLLQPAFSLVTVFVP